MSRNAFGRGGKRKKGREKRREKKRKKEGKRKTFSQLASQLAIARCPCVSTRKFEMAFARRKQTNKHASQSVSQSDEGEEEASE